MHSITSPGLTVLLAAIIARPSHQTAEEMIDESWLR
jgi:hypothetical protein